MQLKMERDARAGAPGSMHAPVDNSPRLENKRVHDLDPHERPVPVWSSTTKQSFAGVTVPAGSSVVRPEHPRCHTDHP